MRLVVLVAVMSLTAVCHATDVYSHISSCVDQNRTTNTSMVIDCTALTVDAKQLSDQLDLLLSDDELRENLTSLLINHTPLTDVPAAVCRLTSLVTLDLAHNRLVRLPDNCLVNMPRLKSLRASFNNITALQDGLFDGLQNLEHLHLDNNQISVIGRGVFTEKTDLINLTYVSLRRNHLTSLEPWPAILGVRRSVDEPLKVIVGNNRIANLCNTIGWHYNCTMPRTYFYVDFSHNQLTRLSDMINGWGLDQHSFMCLSRYREGKPIVRFRIKHNPFICDCRDFWFYSINSYFVYTDIFREVYCSDPIELYRTAVSRIQLIEYTCDVNDGCPPGCQCSYRPGNSTVHVSCSVNNFTSLPLQLPPLPKSYAKYKLDFSNNKLLRRVDYRPYFTKTAFLDVSHCSVEQISFEAWRALVTMSEVFLNDNSMMRVPREYTQLNITSRSISLQRNLWDCSCDRDWMHDWFNSVSVHLSSPSSILCHSPRRLRGTSIMKMHKRAFCVDPVKRAVAVCLAAVFGTVGLFIAICVAVYCLRVWMHRRWQFHPFDRDECVGEDMDYDVFLSCSADDQETHGRRLLELIQSKGYRVCPPTAYATDDVMSAVSRSRRTVCLLSKHFIKRFAFFKMLLVC